MTTMNERRYRRNTKLLWVLILAALGYSMWFYRRDMLTGNPTVDGTLSVIFGLYICSRPAGNATVSIDLFLNGRA